MTDPAPASGQDLLVQEGDIAGDYLERLLDIADVDGDIDMDVEGERAVVAIVGDGLDALVGPGGTVLEAVQELTRLAVVQQTGRPQPAHARHRRLARRPQGRAHRIGTRAASAASSPASRSRWRP
jgi:hypothetical protein